MLNFKVPEAEQGKLHKDPGRVTADPGPSVCRADTCPHESCKAVNSIMINKARSVLHTI